MHLSRLREGQGLAREVPVQVAHGQGRACDIGRAPAELREHGTRLAILHLQAAVQEPTVRVTLLHHLQRVPACLGLLMGRRATASTVRRDLARHLRLLWTASLSRASGALATNGLLEMTSYETVVSYGARGPMDHNGP